MVNVVAVIVVAALFAVAFCVMIPVGIFRSGSSPTQQLRWVFCLWIYAISAIGLGAVALNQPYVSRPDDDRAGGVKLVGWGPDVTVAFTLPFVAAIVSTSIFQSLGARTILPVLTLLTYGSLAMGIFLQDFGMWFWYGRHTTKTK